MPTTDYDYTKGSLAKLGQGLSRAGAQTLNYGIGTIFESAARVANDQRSRPLARSIAQRLISTGDEDALTLGEELGLCAEEIRLRTLDEEAAARSINRHR